MTVNVTFNGETVNNVRIEQFDFDGDGKHVIGMLDSDRIIDHLMESPIEEHRNLDKLIFGTKDGLLMVRMVDQGSNMISNIVVPLTTIRQITATTVRPMRENEIAALMRKMSMQEINRNR